MIILRKSLYKVGQAWLKEEREREIETDRERCQEKKLWVTSKEINELPPPHFYFSSETNSSFVSKTLLIMKNVP